MNRAGVQLASFRRFPHNRGLAIFALIALFFATTAYVSHGYEHDLSSSSHAVAHCDLCLHFSGTAGTPVGADVVGKPPMEARAFPVAEVAHPASSPHPTNRLPRGPPVLTFS